MRAQANKENPPCFDDSDIPIAPIRGRLGLADDSGVDQSGEGITGEDFLEEDEPEEEEETVDPELLLREIRYLEEDYNITIPGELKFSRTIDINEDHKFINLENLILNNMRPMPLLPIYIGILDPVRTTIEPLNYNEKYYRTDMILNKENLVFYQKFYTSLRIRDVVVCPLDDYGVLLPLIEVLIDHLLLVERKLRQKNQYEQAEKDDIVTKIMFYYQQVYPQINAPKQDSPTPPSSDDESFELKYDPDVDPTPSRGKTLNEIVTRVELFDENGPHKKRKLPLLIIQENMEIPEEHEAKVKRFDSKLLSIKLFKAEASVDDATESDSPSNNLFDVDDQDLQNVSKSTPESKHARGLGRKETKTNRSPAEKDQHSIPSRMGIHNFINDELEQEPARRLRRSVVEVEESKIISFSSPPSEKQGNIEVINSTASTNSKRSKNSTQEKSLDQPQVVLESGELARVLGRNNSETSRRNASTKRSKR